LRNGQEVRRYGGTFEESRGSDLDLTLPVAVTFPIVEVFSRFGADHPASQWLYDTTPTTAHPTRLVGRRSVN
jgi:hypothetical protein